MAASHEDRNAQLSPGVAIKAPCRAATTAAITLSGEQVVDATACVTGDRVLVKNQTDQTTNGIYLVSTGAWTREPDFDGNRDVVKGTFVFITNGTVNAGAFYECTTANPITFGSSLLTFAQGALGPIALPLNLSNTTFTQSGTGATARTGLDKTRDIISVKDFGAVGDGVTDDTAAIVAFLLAISGKAGYMPAGTYKVTSTLSLTKNTLLYGDGPNATIINYTGAGVAVQAVGTNDNWDSCIRGIKITTTTGTHGLRLKDLSYFLSESLSCTGFSAAGFHLTGTAVTGLLLMIRMFNCRSYSNTGDGVLVAGVNALNQISIIGCGIQGNTGKGISMSNAGYGIAIIGNEIEGNGTTAELYLNGGGDGYVVTGNYFESSAAIPAIIVADTLATDGGSITGNRFVADVAIANAIRMGVGAFAHGWNVSGNSFVNLYTNAINAQAAKNCVFGPNYCSGSIVHVTNISNSPTGITVFNANNRSVVVYSASMTPDCSLGTEFDITATNGTAFTINAFTNASDDMIRVLTIRNTSGGALGVITWDAVFKMSAWTSPATANSRSITFKFNGTNWVQISQTGVDVPN